MTAFRAVNGESLNWGDAGTWKDGAGVPVSGASNYVIFESGYRYVFSAGMSQGGVDLAGIIVQRGAHVEIPGLTINVNQANGEGIVSYGSGGYIRIAGGTTSQALNFSRHCPLRLEGGTHPLIHGANGGYTYVGDATAEEVVADGAQIELVAKADRIKAEVMNGGLIKSSRDVTDGTTVARGRLDLLADAEITDGGTGGEVKLIDPEAVLRMEHTAAVVHRSIRARLGTVDPSRCVVPPTWTYLYRSPAAKIIEKCLVGRVTVTNRKAYGEEGESKAPQE